MTFNLEEDHLLYEDKKTGLAFYDNPKDLPDGFDCLIGREKDKRDHFYVQSRCLDDLTRGSAQPGDVIRMLDNITQGSASYILRENDIPHERMHEALLQLKIAYLKRENTHLLRENSELQQSRNYSTT